jgi:PAS domain S-box-containing protein
VSRTRSEERALVRRHPAEVLNATVVELALDCIISIDHEGRIIEFNPAAERTFGYKRADVIGHLMAELIIPPHLRRQHYAGMRRYLETGEAQVLGKRLELEAMRADGSTFPVELAIVRVPLPGEPVFTSYLRDLTERRAAEARQQELLASTERLAKSLTAANETLREKTEEALRARDEAHHANKAKSAFLAAMSHELRTPLNAIMGYIELLMLGVHGPLSADQNERLGRVKRSADHLSHLISDVLSFARIEAGRVTYEIAPVTVDGLLQSTAEVLVPQMGAKSLKVVTRNDCAGTRALADREKSLQILINLMSNAVKHAPPLSEIVLGCARKGDRVEFTVTDSGHGIPADKFEEIFRPFTQLEDTYVGDRKGTGLGLAISREMARAMTGDVAVQSSVGKGSTFTLTLPATD